MKLTSIGSEAAALGSIILNHDCFYQADLSAEMFHYPSNQEVYRCICKIIKAKNEPDIVTLREEITDLGNLGRDVGGEVGVNYLVALAESVPTSANFEYYANIVKSKWIDRKISKLGTDIQDIALSDSEEKISQVSKLFASITRHDNDEVVDVFDRVMDIDITETNTFYSTGFPSLDGYICGIGEGEMTIIGGRPGMGKTSFMLGLAYNIAKQGIPVAFFPLEMTADAMMKRLICSKACINLTTARAGFLNDDQKKQVTEAKQEIATAPLLIDTSPRLSVDKLRARLATHTRKYGIKVAMIDHLGLMTGKGPRIEVITNISGALKSLTLEMDISLVVGSQLNRGCESRSCPRPMLSDLRDSGSIEQDADNVILLYRPSYYGQCDDAAEAEVIVAKNRSGSTGKVMFEFVPEYCSFMEASVPFMK